MALELCTGKQVLRWTNSLPLGAFVSLVDVGQYRRRSTDFEHEGLRLAIGVGPVSPFGRATDAERSRLAEAVAQLSAAVETAREAWFSKLVECTPAGVFIPEIAIRLVVDAPGGTVPDVWRPIAEVAPTS